MEYEFYIDRFFLTTLFFNVLSLYLSSVFLKKKRTSWRLLCAAGIGSAWNCFLIFMPVFPMSVEMVVTVVVLGSMMVRIAFEIRGYKENFKAVGMLTMSSVLMGGILSFCRQFFWLEDWESLVLTGVGCLLAERGINYLMKAKKIGDTRYPVRLFYRGKQKMFLALADSGNRLKVPESERPVSVVTGADCLDFCETISGGFYIPYRSVGTGHGILFSTEFDKMEIKRGDEWICIERPVVAFSKEALSADGSFSMILPEEYIR